MASPPDEGLLRAMRAGDRAALEAFKLQHREMFEAICGSVAPDPRSRDEAMDDLFAFEGFAALFADYDPAIRLKTFATVAVVDRFLFPRLMRRLAEAPADHAAAFEAFFRPAIRRVVHRLALDEELQKDAAQWIFEQLLRNDCEQLRGFAQHAKTAGFVVVKLRFLAQDFLNSMDAPAERRKRALPEALKDLPAFDQDVFKQIFWWRSPSAQVTLLGLRQHYPEATEASILDARSRIESKLAAAGGLTIADTRPASLDEIDGVEPAAAADDESGLDETQKSAFRHALLTAATDLTAQEKLYLLMLLQGKPARTIAEHMRLPAADVYVIARRVLRKLRSALADNPAARDLIDAVQETNGSGGRAGRQTAPATRPQHDKGPLP